MIKPSAFSLRRKIFYVAFVGMVGGILMSLLVNALGSAYIRRVFLSPEHVSARYERIAQEFSDYVIQNKISGKDHAAISEWARQRPQVTLIVYSRGSSGGYYQGEADPMVSDGSEQREYLVHFDDGFYRISVAEHTDSRLYTIVTAASVLSGSLCVIAAVMAYSRRLSLRISRLTDEAALVAGCELDHVISPTGSDELSSLAASMNNMRESVITRMGAENRAWQANAELLTAISHDIRTPLTSMIGYLGLLTEEGFDDKARAKQFSDSAYAKALELKELTDELFRYFLVFGKSAPDMDIETLDGDLLLRQMLSEAEYELRDAGFNVKHMCMLRSCAVAVDPKQLSRVLGNLVSNAKKYADPAKQITMISELGEGTLSVCISNYIISDAPRKESTKIGLMTCRKLMQSMGGTFDVREDGVHFSAELTLPTVSE